MRGCLFLLSSAGLVSPGWLPSGEHAGRPHSASVNTGWAYKTGSGWWNVSTFQVWPESILQSLHTSSVFMQVPYVRRPSQLRGQIVWAISEECQSAPDCCRTRINPDLLATRLGVLFLQLNFHILESIHLPYGDNMEILMNNLSRILSSASIFESHVHQQVLDWQPLSHDSWLSSQNKQ